MTIGDTIALSIALVNETLSASSCNKKGGPKPPSRWMVERSVSGSQDARETLEERIIAFD
jgi:hypothetical protein